MFFSPQTCTSWMTLFKVSCDDDFFCATGWWRQLDAAGLQLRRNSSTTLHAPARWRENDRAHQKQQADQIRSSQLESLNAQSKLHGSCIPLRERSLFWLFHGWVLGPQHYTRQNIIKTSAKCIPSRRIVFCQQFQHLRCINVVCNM